MTTNPTPLTAEYIAEQYIDEEEYNIAPFINMVEAYAAQQNAELVATISQFNSAISELQAENERLKQQLAWQPIETAPKDGTRVLLWRRAIRDQPTPIMADGFWCETCWVWPYLLSEPTHWQPLPTPPERAGK